MRAKNPRSSRPRPALGRRRAAARLGDVTGAGLAHGSSSLSGCPHVRAGCCCVAQGTRDLNPQPPVLETGALPIELVPFGAAGPDRMPGRAPSWRLSTTDPRVYARSPVRVEPRTLLVGGWPGEHADDVPHHPPPHLDPDRLDPPSRPRWRSTRSKALKAAGRPVMGSARRADFATPEAIVSAAVEAARQAAIPPLTPAGGCPTSDRHRRQAERRTAATRWAPDQVLVANGGQAGRLPDLRRRCSTPATRCCCPRRTGRRTPSACGWPAASPSRSSPTSPTRATSASVDQR